MPANYNLTGPFYLPHSPNIYVPVTPLHLPITPGLDPPHTSRSKKRFMTQHSIPAHLFNIIIETIKLAVHNGEIDIELATFQHGSEEQRMFCEAASNVVYRIPMQWAGMTEAWEFVASLNEQIKYEMVFIARHLARNIIIKKEAVSIPCDCVEGEGREEK